MKTRSQNKSKRQLFTVLNVNKSLLAVFLFFMGVQCSTKPEEVNKEEVLELIQNNMQEQEEAWNEGDLEEYMKHYWKSDSLRFINKNGLNKGWKQTLTNYKKGYKTKSEMGKLEFTNKSMEILGEEIIFVIGKWELTRADTLGNLEGMYSLLWKKKNGKWVITTDHSS